MAKRIIIISSFPVCAALVVIALVLAGVGRGQLPSAPVSIDSARTNIISLADAGKLADMDAEVNKMALNYKDTAVLTTNYYIIADSLTWRRMYDRASRLYQLVIDNSADSSLVVKARLGLARVEVLGLIGDKKFSLAQEKLDSMIADFNNEPALPATLFHIGQEFSWQHRYTEAKDAFDHIPMTDSLSQQAKLWRARSNICSLIGQAKDSDIVASIDKLMNDFASDAGLPEAVYWISREYEWKKGTVDNRTGWYDAPDSTYQKIMLQFSDTPYGQEAQWDQKRLAHRMKIFKLISEPNQDATDAAIESLVSEFKDRPELAGELYWIACGYEEHPDKEAQARQMYERIIKEFPNMTESSNAVLDLRRLEIWDTINIGDVNTSQILMDKFIVDFKQHPYAGECLGHIADKSYLLALEANKQEQSQQAKDYYARSEGVWNRIIDANLPIDYGKVYYFTAVCREKRKDWNGAIEYCQKVVNDYPNFEYVCGAQAAIGWCYEALRDSNEITKEIANPLIEEAYKAVLTDYSSCYIAHYAALRLAELNLQRGDKITAAWYFNQFLVLAGPKDTRIETVKAKLAAMEGTNQ